MCLGKSLTAGYLPMAATLATAAIYDAFLGDYASGRTFHHGHTYGGNPLAAAAACASLDLLAEERMLEEAAAAQGGQAGGRARAARRPPARGRRAATRTDGGRRTGRRPRDRIGRFPADERRGYRVCRRTTANGVWLRPLGDVIVVMPPLADRRRRAGTARPRARAKASTPSAAMSN